MQKKRIFLLFNFCLAFSFLYAQTEIDKLIKVVMPKAPEAAAFQRYGDIPVDYATGVPSISFPLYEITTGKINLPITLSYHAGGIRVSDVATCVGLGFSLNMGGRINRTIIDKEDLGGNIALYFNTPSEYETARNAAIQTSANAADIKLSELAEKVWYDKTYGDKMTDRYTLFLPNGKSVVFRQNFMTGVFEQMPFENLKIELISDKFKITDADGIIYHFDTMDSDGWNLTKIEAPGENNFIELTYGATQYNNLVGHPAFVEESGAWINTSYYQNGSSAHCWSGTMGTQINQYYGGGQSGGTTNNLVTKIAGSDIEVLFSYASGRSDPGSLKLTEMKVIDKNFAQERKKVTFKYGQFGNSNDKTWRLKLDSFTVLPVDSAASVSETYSFSYNEDVVLPPYFDINYHHLYHEDFWGYYNGTSTLKNIPIELVENSSNGSDRYPNPSFSKACSLKEVVYPTGGKTVYELENNYGMNYEYPFLTNTQNGVGYGGGLRVKSIKNYTSSGQLATTKTYEYDGQSTKSINPNLFSYDKRLVKTLDPFYMGYAMNRTFAVAEPVEFLSIGGNPSIIYGVKEFLGTPTDNIGYTTYSYGLPPRQEYNSYEFPNLSMKHAWQWDYGAEKPLLSYMYVYKKEESGVYTLQKEEIYEYAAYKQRKFSTGINVVQGTSYTGHNYWIELSAQIADVASSQNFSWCLYWGPDPTTEAPAANEFFSNDNLFAVATSGYIASHLLTKKTEHLLSNGSYLTNITNYDYDSVTTLLRSQTTINSNADSLKTTFTYPADYTAAPYPTMVSKNILTPVIEKSNYKNSTTFLQSVKTNYNFWSNTGWSSDTTGLIMPQSIESKTLNNNVEVRARYHSYDNRGNVISVSKESDIKSTLVWDYNNTYPVAQVANADAGSVAYTSFEAEGKGGWTFSGSTNGTYSITGSKGYNTSGGNITKSGLTNNAYIVSYWGRTGSVNVNSAGPTRTGKTRGLWTYYEHEVTTTSITVSGSIYIDELRLYPKNAQMTTYTHTPLIGISSQSDANGRIIYYEYDAFNRLRLVRDIDSNIIRKICYNYSGQPEDCNEPCLTTVANWQNITDSIRCKQAGGFNNGEREQKQVDLNSCSATYNQTRWTVTGTDTNACPLPPPSEIYARLEYDDGYWDLGSYYATVVIRFYSDDTGTTPAYVSSLTVNYETERVRCNSVVIYGGGSPSCSGVQHSLGNIKLVSAGSGINCYTLNYALAADAGYTIIY